MIFIQHKKKSRFIFQLSSLNQNQSVQVNYFYVKIDVKLSSSRQTWFFLARKTNWYYYLGNFGYFILNLLYCRIASLICVI